MTRTGIPFLIGGGNALHHYTKGVRGTKDLDLYQVGAAGARS